jgi:hypothetical protein
MRGDAPLDLGGADVGAAADDDVLQPTRDPQVALLVEATEVPGVVAALPVDRRGRPLQVAPVAEHRTRAPVADLALLARRHVLAVGADEVDPDAVERGGPVGSRPPLERVAVMAARRGEDLGAMGAHARLDAVARAQTLGEIALHDAGVELPPEFHSAVKALVNLSPA